MKLRFVLILAVALSGCDEWLYWKHWGLYIDGKHYYSYSSRLGSGSTTLM